MESIRDKSAHERLLRARAALITGQPFFGALALSQTLVERPSIETAAVDGKSLFYAPSFVQGLTEPQTIGMLAHEVMHVALMHHVRRGGRDANEWNIAADIAVNSAVLDAGFVLPPGAIVDRSYDGMGVEEIFAARAGAKAQAQQEPGDEPEPGDDGQESPQSGGDDASGDDSGDEGEGAGAPSEGEGEANGGPGDDGATGNGGPGEQPAPDPGRCGGVLDAASDAPGLAEAAANTESMVRQAIAVAASQAGELPAGLKRIVDELNKPRVSWRDVLARFIDDAATRALDWNRPNKRFLDSGFFLPGSQPDSVGTIAVCVDTSGSIDDATLATFAAEVQAMLDDGRVERVAIVYCDAEVNGTQEFTTGETVKMEPAGGGGTSFAPALAHVAEHCPEAAAIVYLTDLECYGRGGWGMEPSMPVLWVVWGRHRWAPFGEVVPLDPYA